MVKIKLFIQCVFWIRKQHIICTLQIHVEIFWQFLGQTFCFITLLEEFYYHSIHMYTTQRYEPIPNQAHFSITCVNSSTKMCKDGLSDTSGCRQAISDSGTTLGTLHRIAFIQAKFGVKLPFSDRFSTKRKFVWC